jgi:hypothetical protein
MRRREFIRLLSGTATAWPLAARAQQAAIPVIGFLGGADPAGYAPQIEALRLGLRDHGYVEGQNIAIEYRWAEGRYDRLVALAADLVRRKVAVIVTQGTPAASAGGCMPMVVVWLLFTVMLFVAEPLFLHRWLLDRAKAEPEATFRLVERLHRVLLTLSLITLVAAVAGSHGFVLFE